MPQTTLTAVPYRPSAPLRGDEVALYDGENMRLRGNPPWMFYECYQGSQDLREPIPSVILTGTISFDPTSSTISGTGTDFLDELHIGQMILAEGEPIVVKSLETQTSFTAAKAPGSTAVDVDAYRLPILFALDVKRGAMLRGNALHYDRGTILAVGDGTLYLNGDPLPGESLVASRQAQVALYDSSTMQYSVEDIGFDSVPTAPTVAVVSGSTKTMSLGFYSFRVSYYSDITSGYGNPTDPILNTNAWFQITAPDEMFEFDFSGDTPPSKATGYIIYATIYGGASDVSAVSAIEGAWFELARVPLTSLTAGKVDISYVDSDLSSITASFNNDMPPDAEFYTSIDRYPFLVSTDGKGVDSTGRETTTSPGAFVAPIKADNFDGYPAGYRVPTEKGETIIGVVSSAGRAFVLTSNTLQAVTPTGLPDAPFTCRPFWKRGFSNPYNVTFIDDTIYGFSGTSIFRSIASGDAGQESQDFASDVEDIFAQFNPAYVYLEYDPLNAEMCVFVSAVRQNDQGYWETDIYPYSLRKYGWQPPVVLTDPNRDMIVSGVAAVNGHLEFIAGGRCENIACRVAGAGSLSVNTLYTLRGTANGKGYYCPERLTSSTTISAVVWSGTKWEIYDANGTLMYDSVEDVDYPWQVVTWHREGGANPLPNVVVENENRHDTFRYDTGADSPVPWFLSWTFSDSGVEIIPKVLRDLRPKGKFTDTTVQLHVVYPDSDIDVSGLGDGTGAAYEYTLDDSTGVKQYKVQKCRVKNALMWTARVNGTWDGAGLKDQFHELALTVDVSGQER